MQPKHTAIAIVRDHVEAWRRDNDWSRETVVQHIVDAHERLALDRLTGIRFDPPTKDQFERMRVNADKVFRWLDDHTKDRNLLTVNFLWSILAAMPADRRLALADALLAPVDLGAREEIDEIEIGPAGEGQDRAVMQHIQAVVTTAAEAQSAMVSLGDGVHAGEPEAATVKLSRMAAAGQRALGLMRFLRRVGKRTAA